MAGIDLQGAIEALPGLGDQPGGVVSLHVLDPLYLGAPNGTYRWTLISVQQPSILFPLYGPDYVSFAPWSTVASGVAPPNISSFLNTLLYTYKQPQADNVVAYTNPTYQHSAQGGVCFLDRAGNWWVGLDATVSLTVAIIPVFSQSQADRFMDGLRPNTSHCIRKNLEAAGTGTAQAGLLLGWDIRRRGYMISNNAGKAAAIRFGDAGTAPLLSLADQATLFIGPDQSPCAPVMAEAATGAQVLNGLTVTTFLL